MTRFARAKGSKASNERRPESATPWSEMKQQLIQKKHEDDNKEKRDEMNARKINIYKEFLAEHRQNESKETKWAEFPGVIKTDNNSKIKRKNKKEKLLLGMKMLSDGDLVEKQSKKLPKQSKKLPKQSKKLPKQSKKLPKEKENSGEMDIDDEDDFNIEEGASDDESSEEFNNIKAKLDKILECEGFEDANGEVANNTTNISNGRSDDEAPEESSSKTEQPQVKVKKVKQKKIKLEIPSEKIQNEIAPERKTKKNKQNGATNDDQSAVSPKLEKKKKGGNNKSIEKQKGKGNQDKKTKQKILNFDELDEKTKKKIERKRRKHQRQAERRQLKRAKLAAEKEAQGNNEANKDGELSKNFDNHQNDGRKGPDERHGIVQNNKKQKSTGREQSKNGRLSNDSEQLMNGPDGANQMSPQAKREKQKKKKKLDGEKARRKPLNASSMVINGQVIDLEYIEGFPVRKEDAERLKQLRKQMISKGLPRSEINSALKLERRRAEKALSRLKKEVCFNCRKSGHNLSECPQLNNGDSTQMMPMDICFKCGSTEHKSYECKVVKGDSFKFATCFICKEQGHLSKQCPDNPRGMYPKGGACNVCGDVTHLKKDCPQYQTQQQERDSADVELMGGSNPDDLGDSTGQKTMNGSQKRINKVIKF